VKRLIEAPGFGLVCASCDADLYWEARLAALTPEQEAAERAGDFPWGGVGQYDRTTREIVEGLRESLARARAHYGYDAGA
jgi:hypothetical protein